MSFEKPDFEENIESNEYKEARLAEAHVQILSSLIANELPFSEDESEAVAQWQKENVPAFAEAFDDIVAEHPDLPDQWLAAPESTREMFLERMREIKERDKKLDIQSI